MAVAVDSLITPEILKPARYLGNELGAVHKPWESATVRWALTYPEIYEVGASNLGHIILYSIINAQPRQLCDRAYLPAADLAQKLRDTQTPLFGVESQKSLAEFDILGFSLSYELGATNILEMLTLAGIPLTWRERAAGNYPLIFAGGQTATSNPEPYADFFDFIALGDGEELLPEIGLVVEDGKTAGLSRRDLLLDLAQVPGVYVPQFYDLHPDGSVKPNHPDVPERILRRVATPIPAYSIGLVPYVETVHDRLTIEIRRGCTRGCRFCQPGMLTRPARDVEPEAVINAIETGMRSTGYDEFSLLSLSCSDYLALPAVGLEIKNRLKDENISLSLPSQRVDRFDEDIANIIGGTRKGGLTFAPEAGTQRLRDIINKGLTNEELLRGVKTGFEQGWDKIKLYFMIGLPGETDVDVVGIAETVRWLKRECWAKDRRTLNFNITISNFTPKPHTPFQWHSVSTTEFARKQRLLKDEFRDLRGVKVNYTDVRISAMEDFVGRGDRSLAPVIRRAWELGAGMDAWWESLEKAYGAWAQAIYEAGLDWKYRRVENGEWNIFEDLPPQPPLERGASDPASSPFQGEGWGGVKISAETPTNSRAPKLKPRITESEAVPTLLATDIATDSAGSIESLELPSVPLPHNLNAPLPWDHLDTGIDKKWLQDDLERALAAGIVPDCSFDGCSHCGVCGTDFGHNVIVPPMPIPEFTGQFTPNTNKVQRLRVWFGKIGKMSLVGHLDLARLFDRAIRRASIPVTYSGGFHPAPRIMIANALPLGSTSTGEIADFELTTTMDEAEFHTKLAAQLPTDIPIYRVESVDLKQSPASTLITQAEYITTVSSASETSPQWENWIATVLASQEIIQDKKSKSGKNTQINLRDRLYELELMKVTGETDVELRYVGSCVNDGTLLRPEQMVFMLEQVSGVELQLVKVVRSRLILSE
ncbi:TIGR03960 family B12-binding radical SAM protein [Chamaesiphon sp.]|uniref:TIGR03960 family B12-binding radical SAM protein n=1 Tax=Chamaesiphon sp. TaxID=2814140 RepID=UPI003594137B